MQQASNNGLGNIEDERTAVKSDFISTEIHYRKFGKARVKLLENL